MCLFLFVSSKLCLQFSLERLNIVFTDLTLSTCDLSVCYKSQEQFYKVPLTANCTARVITANHELRVLIVPELTVVIYWSDSQHDITAACKLTSSFTSHPSSHCSWMETLVLFACFCLCCHLDSVLLFSQILYIQHLRTVVKTKCNCTYRIQYFIEHGIGSDDEIIGNLRNCLEFCGEPGIGRTHILRCEFFYKLWFKLLLLLLFFICIYFIFILSSVSFIQSLCHLSFQVPFESMTNCICHDLRI